MTTAMPWWPSVTGALVLVLVGTGVHVAQAQPAYPTSSSEWGPGYGAAAAADAIADEDSNYWQTIEGEDKGAWWQLDLGQVFSVKGVKIAWARCEDKYHCPPASATVQVSLTGKEGSWKDVRKIADNEIPRDEQPYELERERSYPLPEAAPARYVRLLFPDGDQPVLRITGIRLSPGGDEPPVATEDWTLSAPGDGSQLIWKIVRRALPGRHGGGHRSRRPRRAGHLAHVEAAGGQSSTAEGLVQGGGRSPLQRSPPSGDHR